MRIEEVLSLQRSCLDALDPLSVSSARAHRAVVWLAYLLSPFAVLLGALQLLQPEGSGWSIWISAVEICVIASLWLAYWLARRQRWLDQWQAVRYVSELVRLTPLAALARDARSRVLNTLRSGGGTLDDTNRQRVNQLVDAWESNARLSPAELAEEYGAAKAAIRDLLQGQREYHEKKAQRESRKSSILHTVALLAVIAAGVAVVLEPLLHIKELAICAVVFPAVAGAAHGLEALFRFEEIAEQSTHVREAIHAAITALEEAPARSPQVDQAMDEALGVLERELAGWRLHVRAAELKPL